MVKDHIKDMLKTVWSKIQMMETNKYNPLAQNM